MRLVARRPLAGAAGGLAALAAAAAIATRPPEAAAAGFTCRTSAASLYVGGVPIGEFAVANGPGAPCAADSATVQEADVNGPDQVPEVPSAQLDITAADALTAPSPVSAIAQSGLAQATLDLPGDLEGTSERRVLGLSGFFFGATLRVQNVQSTAGYSCANGQPAPFGSSSVGALGRQLPEQPGVFELLTLPQSGTLDLEPELPGRFIARINEQLVTPTEVIQRALVIERPDREVVVVFGEARAGLDGNPCAPATTTPTTPAPPAAPGQAQVASVVSTGRPGDELVITGSGFGVSQGADDRVTVRGEPAAATSWGDTRIVVLVPNLTPGPGELRLRIRGVETTGPPVAIVVDPPQPPVVNLLVVPLPGGRILVDTSTTIDPDTSQPGAPAERGDNSTFDLYDGLRSVLTRIDGGEPSRKSSTVAELTPGKHEVEVTATSNDGGSATVRKRVFVPPLSPLRRIANLTRVRIKPVRVPPADITIPAQLLFDVGSARLHPEAARYLSGVARALRLARAPARVTGYTDATGPAGFNQRLSRDRARAVRAFLAGRGRVPVRRLTALGRGERDPVASNATAAGRQRNRRVVIRIKTPTKSTVLTGPSAVKRVAQVRNLQARVRAESRRPNRPPTNGAPDGIGIYAREVPWLAYGGKV